MGAGPMTGRAAGYCAGNAVPGRPAFGRGRGCGMGFGGGRGFGRGFGQGWNRPAFGAVAPTADQELAALKQQAQQLQTNMDSIQTRIRELEAKPE